MTIGQINNLTREQLINALLTTAHNCNTRIKDLENQVRDLESENAALKAKISPSAVNMGSAGLDHHPRNA